MSNDPQPGNAQPGDGQPPQHPPTAQFPPVNYAPPGQAPDYGAQYPAPYAPGDYPPPPGYGYGYPGYPPPPPAGPPPRKSNAPLIAVIIAVALLLCGGVATTGILVAHNVSTRAHEAVKPLTDPNQPDPNQPDPNLPDLPTDVPGLPTDIPTDGGSQITVTYQVTGDGPAEILYIDKLGAAPTRVDDVKLPWSFNTTMQTPALVSIIAMRAGTTDGQVTCRALVDGNEVKKATSDDNAFATAACSYFALD